MMEKLIKLKADRNHYKNEVSESEYDEYGEKVSKKTK